MSLERIVEMTRWLAENGPVEQASSWPDTFEHLASVSGLEVAQVRRLIDDAATPGLTFGPGVDMVDRARATAVQGFLTGLAAAATRPPAWES